MSELYRKTREEEKNDWLSLLEQLQSVKQELQQSKIWLEKKPYQQYFLKITEWILALREVEKHHETGFIKRSLEELQKENAFFYEDIVEENYEMSYANPAYAVKIFGDEIGQILSFFFLRYRTFLHHIFDAEYFMLVDHLQNFFHVYEYCKREKIDISTLSKKATAVVSQSSVARNRLSLRRSFDPDFGYYRRVILESDLADPRYLYLYGCNISENELKMSRFLNSLPEKKLEAIAEQMVKSYIMGLNNRHRNFESRRNLSVHWAAGMEKLLRVVIQRFEEKGFRLLFSNPQTTAANKQYNYDHRFDQALYLTEEFVKNESITYEEAMNAEKEFAAAFGGSVVFFNFGEKPYQRTNKDECLKFSDEQQEIFKGFQHQMMKIKEQYVPEVEISFTCISFPVPEIGEHFEEIFEAMIGVNCLDTDVWEEIQQKMIDILDQGKYVHVKGKSGNQTDIRVSLMPLTDSEKETIFINCGADINIPVGEVFTSPQLKGTEGLLHINETYLTGMPFKDLKLTFTDGYISDYNCANFEGDEENKNYVRETLFFPHDTLPLGEFAIGTNTPAYVMVQKYGILNCLHELIIEKMGPHFAIGDTCFGMNEDSPQYNRYNGKKMIAVENEKTCNRHQNMNEAYTFRHTDITLPYESIDFIRVYMADGTGEDIIRDGKFVVAGTEELNVPFLDMK